MAEKRDSAVRTAALARDRWCIKCLSARSLHVHHIKAVADGGTDTLDNVDVLCSRCHREWHATAEGTIEYDEFLWEIPAFVLQRCMRHPELSGCSGTELLAAWSAAGLRLAAARVGRKVTLGDGGLISAAPFEGSDVAFDLKAWRPWADVLGDAIAYFAKLPGARAMLALRASGRAPSLRASEAP